MNILEAIQTGKPFRIRNVMKQWLIMKGGLVRDFRPYEANHISARDVLIESFLLSNDWEVLETASFPIITEGPMNTVWSGLTDQQLVAIYLAKDKKVRLTIELIE